MTQSRAGAGKTEVDSLAHSDEHGEGSANPIMEIAAHNAMLITHNPCWSPVHLGLVCHYVF